MENILEEKKTYGFGIDYMMIGLIVLVCIILLGGIYLMTKKSE